MIQLNYSKKGDALLNHYFTDNQNLKSQLRTIEYNYKDYKFLFWSDIGVFSKNKIDFGSRVLVEAILKEAKSGISILDVGCGYGFIGITLAKVLSSKVDLCDINLRAVHLAKMNVKENKVAANVFSSNIYDNINNKYDLIVSNPPIRAGKNIVIDILVGAKEFLNNEGEVWCVIRKDQGAKSIEKILKEHYLCKIVEKTKGFFVFSLKNIDKG